MAGAEVLERAEREAQELAQGNARPSLSKRGETSGASDSGARAAGGRSSGACGNRVAPEFERDGNAH
eukprot:11839911-Alexandrium_andersonii.AAC.1